MYRLSNNSIANDSAQHTPMKSPKCLNNIEHCNTQNVCTLIGNSTTKVCANYRATQHPKKSVKCQPLKHLNTQVVCTMQGTGSPKECALYKAKKDPKWVHTLLNLAGSLEDSVYSFFFNPRYCAHQFGDLCHVVFTYFAFWLPDCEPSFWWFNCLIVCAHFCYSIARYGPCIFSISLRAPSAQCTGNATI